MNKPLKHILKPSAGLFGISIIIMVIVGGENNFYGSRIVITENEVWPYILCIVLVGLQTLFYLVESIQYFVDLWLS